jgi:formylglycine-generating enzyme required for sulfatase activity
MQTEAGLVRIPAGEFMMGTRKKSEPGRYCVERRHRVKLTKGFWMGKYEVTQEQWEKLMGYNPSGFTNAGPRAPVECVNLPDCQRFMTKLNRAAVAGAGKFRLPTEAEWEWACRAGTDGPLYTGSMTIKGANNSPELDAIAWYGGNSGVEYEGGYDSSHWPDKQKEFRFAGTHPVGQKKPNAWGLHDMLGNVRERCQDGFDEWDVKTFASRNVTDPVGQDIDNRIMRGGSWSDLARQCRCPSRQYRTGMRAWHRSIGFRVAMDEPVAAAAEKAK